MIIKSNKIKVKMFYNCIYGGKKWVITLQDYSYIIATQYFKDYMQGQIVCGCPRETFLVVSNFNDQ